MKTKLLLMLLVAAAAVFTLSASAGAAPITITVPNAGFEERETFDPFPYSTDKYNKWAQEYWRHFECDNNGGPLRIWKPGDPANPAHLTTQGIADVGFGGNPPEGDYVVVVRTRYNDDEFHDPPQVRDFEAAVQILTDTFDPTMTYTLTAKVGRLVGSVNYTPDWHGYALQLAVGGTNVGGASYAGRVDGGTVIAEDSGTVVPVDGFVTVTCVYTPDPAYDYLAGEPLQIRLCALENPADHSLTSWVAFDDVTLEAYACYPMNPYPNGITVPTGSVDLSWTNRDPNNPGDPVYVDVWFGTDPNQDAGPNWTKVVDAEPNVTSVPVDASVDGTYYWQVNSYLYGSPTGDPCESCVFTFNAVSDLPPTVDAGADMITWSGQAVQLDATVTDDGVSALTYAWSANPGVGVVFDPSATVENPTVTITKATANPSTVTLTLAVNDEGNPTPVEDTMDIDVYDNACQAAVGAGITTIGPADFDENCITDVKDLAVMLATWLDDIALTAPVPK